MLKLQNCLISIFVYLFHYRISAHSLILFALSPYFRALLTSPLDESTQDVIRIEEIDGQTLEQLIDFCYTGEILINDENVVDIIAAASKIELIPVEQLCDEYLTKHLCLTNCLSSWLLAEQYSLVNVRTIALNMVQFEFVDVINDDEFFNLNSDAVNILLANDELCVYSEEIIFNALISWIQFDGQIRSPLFPYLIKLVRIEYIQMKVRFWQLSAAGKDN